MILTIGSHPKQIPKDFKCFHSSDCIDFEVIIVWICAKVGQFLSDRKDTSPFAICNLHFINERKQQGMVPSKSDM